MAHNTRLANLISYRKPDCQPSRTIAIPSRHTIPATPHSPHYQAARSGDTITTPHATRYQLQHDTAQHSAQHRQGHSVGLRNLLFIGRRDGIAPCPTTPDSRSSKCGKPLSPEELPISLFLHLSALCSYADLCLSPLVMRPKNSIWFLDQTE